MFSDISPGKWSSIWQTGRTLYWKKRIDQTAGGRRWTKKIDQFRPVSSIFRPVFVQFRPVDEKGNFWWTKISSKKFVRWTKNHQNTLKISSTCSSTQRQNFVHLRETFALHTAKRHGKAQNTLSCAVVVEPPTQRKLLYINDFGHKIIVRLHCIKITERLWWKRVDSNHRSQ